MREMLSDNARKGREPSMTEPHGRKKDEGSKDGSSHGPGKVPTIPPFLLPPDIGFAKLRPQPEIVAELHKARKGGYWGESWQWNEAYQIALEWVLNLDVSPEQRAKLNKWSKEAQIWR